jgi:hypothetical protein
MAVWDLLHLENEVKKYLELALNPVFNDEQREKFRNFALKARQNLIREMSEIEERIYKRGKEAKK